LNFFCLAETFCGEGTAGNEGGLGFGAGSAVVFDTASAPLLLVPKENNPPGGDGGGTVLRDVYQVVMPVGNFCIFQALDYDGEGVGAKALREITADFVSDQPKYAIENMPLKNWGKWDSNRTPCTYANAMRSTSKWGGGIELAINPIKEKYNVLVYEKKPEKPGAYRCISRFEFPGALKTKRLLYCGRNH
jgi:hypothetical protein